MAEPNMLIPLPDEMARLMKLTQWQAEQIERRRARVFALEDAQGGDAIPLAEPRTPEAQRTAEICLSEWATARMEAMEAAIGALQREAHTWWTALAGATAESEQWRRSAERCVTAWPVVRGGVWDPNGLMDELALKPEGGRHLPLRAAA